MTEGKCRAHIYFFDQEDGKSTDRRLKQAVVHYCKACGIVLPSNEADLSELLQVARAERGKPYFPNFPQLLFSISHSGSFWVCALAEEAIGIDLQEYVRLKGETVEEASNRFRKMSHRFFHSLEAEYVELDCYHNFFGVWTARESYVKYTGQGIDQEFGEHCVVPVNKTEWQRLTGVSEAVSWMAQGVCFWQKTYPDNYTLCVCTKKPCNCTIHDFRKF